MINTSKPTTSITNGTKISVGETWGSIPSTWASDTRTWLAASQLIENTSKPRSLGSYTFDEIGNRIISDTGGAMNDSSFMINQSKP